MLNQFTIAGSEKDNKVNLVITSCIIAILILILLLIVTVILYRRRNLYGGFYIFTVPPVIDYIEKLDNQKSLIRQINKLPYMTEWEFPRELVHIGKQWLYSTDLKNRTGSSIYCWETETNGGHIGVTT